MSNTLTDPRTTERVEKFRQAFPEAEVEIQHTGGGCHWLCVSYPGTPLYYALTDGEAFLPEPTEGWRFVGLFSEEDDSPHYEGTALRQSGEYADGPTFSDEVAIATILRHREEGEALTDEERDALQTVAGMVLDLDHDDGGDLLRDVAQVEAETVLSALAKIGRGREEVPTPTPPRTILVHLNIETHAGDERTADDLAQAVLDNLDLTRLRASVDVPLAEDLGPVEASSSPRLSDEWSRS